MLTGEKELLYLPEHW